METGVCTHEKKRHIETVFVDTSNLWLTVYLPLEYTEHTQKCTMVYQSVFQCLPMADPMGGPTLNGVRCQLLTQLWFVKFVKMEELVPLGGLYLVCLLDPPMLVDLTGTLLGYV